MNSVSFVIYDAATGAIRLTGQATSPEALEIQQLTPGEAIMETDGQYRSQDFYVDLASLSISGRPAVAVEDATLSADGVSVYRLEGLPTGTDLRLDGTAYTIDDGVFELVTDEAQVFKVEIAPPFPYRPSSLKVTAQ